MTLADLEVKKTLGTGSFGRVLLVRHIPTGKHYAMKVLKKAQVVRMKQVRLSAEWKRPNRAGLPRPFQPQRHLSLSDSPLSFLIPYRWSTR